MPKGPPSLLTSLHGLVALTAFSPTLESIDTLLKEQFDKMVEDKVLSDNIPQARVSFLTNEAPLEVETEDEDNDLF